MPKKNASNNAKQNVEDAVQSAHSSNEQKATRRLTWRYANEEL